MPDPPLLVWSIFPLADLRPLTLPAADQVTKPWRTLRDANFLRSFGAQRQRKTGEPAATGLARYVRTSEGWYFSARRFVRLADPAGTITQPVSARLYADGVISARLELVFRIDPAGQSLEACLTRLANAAMLLPMRDTKGRLVPDPPTVQLHQLPSALRRTFATASVTRVRRQALVDAITAGGKPLQAALAFVRPADPLLIVHGGTAAGAALRWGNSVQAGNTRFRTLLVEPLLDPARDGSLRRAFVKLHCLLTALGDADKALAGPATGVPDRVWLEAMNRLVQGTEAAALNLREVGSTSIDALQALADRFTETAQAMGERLQVAHPDHAEIQRFAGRLMRTGPTWKLAALSATKRLPRVDGLLAAETIDRIQAILVETGFAAKLPGLLKAISPDQAIAVPFADTVVDTAWNHLMFLNGLADSQALHALLAAISANLHLGLKARQAAAIADCAATLSA